MILIVDQDIDHRERLAEGLDPNGGRCLLAADAELGLFELSQHAVDLAVIDMHLPGLDGPELIGEMRRRFPSVPVIAMAAAGADDAPSIGNSPVVRCMAKPLDVAQMKPIVADLLDRTACRLARPVTAGTLVVNPASGRVLVDDREMVLGGAEVRVLAELVRSPKEVHTHTRLHERAFGAPSADPNPIEALVGRLRVAFDRPGEASRIVTVGDSGYRYRT